MHVIFEVTNLFRKQPNENLGRHNCEQVCDPSNVFLGM